jgi:hypothetical protein
MAIEHGPSSSWIGICRRTRLVAIGIGFTLALSAGPVRATHTLGTLECGPAGTFEVEAGSSAPPDFEAPVPWSGLFLLEGTNRVFRAFRIETPRSSILLQAADHNSHAVVTCTLTSSGFNFEAPWTLVGFMAP